MHIHFLDPYRPRESTIHQLDPRVKLILTLAFILTVALTPIGAWPVYILLFSIILSIEILSQLGVGYVLKRAMLAFPFMLAAIPVIFTTAGHELIRFSLGPWSLVLTLAGLERFTSIALKSWLSVQAAIILASSTTFPELLVAMRAVKTPRLLVAIFGLMWRYLFVLVDEALRLMRARSARSGHSDQPELRPGGSVYWRARVTGGMAGSLFLRAFERSDRIYMAMISRGYDGEVRTAPLPQLRSTDRIFLAFSLGILAIMLVFAVLVWS
jgi:cobalt/nickel transport system permease protein